MTEIAKDRPAKRQIPNIPLKRLKGLWMTQRQTEEIAILLQVSLPYLYTLAKKHNLPKRTHIKTEKRKAGEKEIDPTPEEIIARAAEVRMRWTDADYLRSLKVKPKNVEIRSYSYDMRTSNFSEVTPNY